VRSPANLLDVGAATGEFLSIAREAGYRVAGLELSRFAAEQAREKFGLDLYVGPLDTFETGTPYDIIHLSHVLEHVPEPHTAVAKLDDILSERGVVYVEVPYQWNWAEQLHYFRGRRQEFNAFSMHHRLFFRPRTLTSLFTQHGFACRHLSLMPPNRYPLGSFTAWCKRTAWKGLAVLGQGLFIEAIFSRGGRKSRRDDWQIP
jgi:2-polyprenyl-3-methyl-5-hydroxy-6-metoxy-1,4-benzoquinol methylase